MKEDSIFLPLAFYKNRDKVSRLGRSGNCPIWGNVNNNVCLFFEHKDSHYYWSPKGGGGFQFTRTLVACIGNYLNNERDKIVLSRWIFERNLNGNLPKITTSDVEKILTREDSTVNGKLGRILELHDLLAERPSIGLWHAGGISRNSYDVLLLLQAGANLGTMGDYLWLREAALEEGLLQTYRHSLSEFQRLTPEGINKISTNSKATRQQQAFVAMWFDSQMDKPYENAILKAITATGHSAYRVDKDNSHSDQITNKILAEIKRSKFLIADFTHGAEGARGGVYFEAGYALGLGIPVLWLIRKDDVSKMHFDTNHYPHIVWETETQLKEQLEAAILAHQHIGRGQN